MIKVYIAPDYANIPKDKDNGGVRRVAEAMIEHLHKFDVEVVHNPNEADVINNHGGILVERKGIPSVNTSHGLYWSRQPWGNGYKEVNEELVESMAHAVAHTAPSEWVATAIRRGGFWYPEVVYHGVDGDKFLPSRTHGKYILWAKARADHVSNPQDMQTLAGLMPDRAFWSTIGHVAGNVKVLNKSPNDPMPHAQMKKVMSEAGLYLSTARETFGIGTLEAMAYGVPVVGWDWGGNSEIIQQGVTGYLAPPGDYRALAEMIEIAFAERERLSRNCIEDVRENWRWEPRIKQYADIFKRVCSSKNSMKPKVSVIVTTYKLDQYLPQCLQSISSQTFRDFECFVLDGASLQSTKIITEEFSKRNPRIKYIPNQEVIGLVNRRNYGFSISKGELIRHVDADDWLAENALELEVTAADNDRGSHIFYGHIGVGNIDGSMRQERIGWPEPNFNWYKQMAHMNQLPSCSMVRREVYERSGGYRERMRRQEDAEFWCRVTSLGFRAKKFTEAITYWHRERPDSKGAEEWKNGGGEPDWTAWFPWRMSALNYRNASEALRKRGEIPENPNIVPFGAQGKSPAPMRFWHIHDYAYPVVSVIVTVGPTHERYLLDALDSIQAQRYTDWECVVVNDTGKKWDKYIMGAPWAKVVNMEGNQGAAAARNEGFKHTKGRYVIWLDADDYWLPWTLEKMVAYAEINDGAIYSDFIRNIDGREHKIYSYRDFEPKFLLSGCATPGTSVLIPRKYAEAVIEKYGGWDEKIVGMEDWDYQYALCTVGCCFRHIPEPLFVYRMYSSTKRERDHEKADIIKVYMERKWNIYRTGKESLMCGCTQTKKPNEQTQSASIPATEDNKFVEVEYLGDNAAPFRIASNMDRNLMYRFSSTELHRTSNVMRGDLPKLFGLTDKEGKPLFRQVATLEQSPADDPAAFLGQAVTA